MNIGLFPVFTIYEDECKSFLMGLIVLITDALEQALKSANICLLTLLQSYLVILVSVYFK